MPGPIVSDEKVTVLCAGAPGKPHPAAVDGAHRVSANTAEGEMDTERIMNDENRDDWQISEKKNPLFFKKVVLKHNH